MARTKWTRAQMLRDPKKRAKIPTSQLPAKYRAARMRRLSAEKDAKNPLLNPTRQLAGRDLRVAVNDLVDLETRPKLDAADFEIKSAGLQSAALANRHGQIAGRVAGADTAAGARAAAISERVRQNMARISQEGANAVDASGKAAQEALGQQGTGLQGSAAERLAAERAALNARQTGVSTQYQSSNEALSGVDEGYQAKMAATNQARLAEQAGAAQIRQSNNMAKLAAERASIEASRGPLRTETLLGLRQQGFTNMLSAETLGLNQAKLEEDARQAALNAKVKREGIKATQKSNAAARKSREKIAGLNRANQRLLTKERLTQSERGSLRSAGIDPDTRKPIPGGKLDPKAKPKKDERRTGLQTRSALDQVGTAKSWLQTAKEGNIPRHQARAALLRGLGKGAAKAPKTRELFARVALDLTYDAHLSAETRRLLKDAGYDWTKFGPQHAPRKKPGPLDIAGQAIAGLR
jgi:hypothetical protein